MINLNQHNTLSQYNKYIYIYYLCVVYVYCVCAYVFKISKHVLYRFCKIHATKFVYVLTGLTWVRVHDLGIMRCCQSLTALMR